MELSQVVKDVMAVLTPALPYLVATGTEAAKEVGKSVGKAIPEGVKKIWEVLNYNIELRPPGLQEAITDVNKAPEDTDSLDLLELQVKKVLKEDNELVKKLSELLQDESVQEEIERIRQITQTSSGNQSPNIVSEGNVTMTYGNPK